MNAHTFFTTVEQFHAPSTILFRSIELKLLRKTIHKYCKPFHTILDLGCGDGIAASLLFDKPITFGLDTEQAYICIASKSGQYGNVILADARTIPLDTGSVNTVISNSVIEHIPDKDAVLSEVRRVVKNNGYFIFTSIGPKFKDYSIFSKLKMNYLAQLYGAARNHKYNHYNCLSVIQWKRELKKYGFDVVDSYYYIDKQTAELWDILLIASYPFRILSRSLTTILYNKLLRKRVYYHFAHARKVASGAGVCIVAKKITIPHA